MKVAVIGANGQLGSDVYKAFQDNGDERIALDQFGWKLVTWNQLGQC
ncbi:hypothetical protein ACFLZL_02010 [Thermodesulfobacteriota bacterium]